MHPLHEASQKWRLENPSYEGSVANQIGKFCILYRVSTEIPQALDAHQNIQSFENPSSQEIC